MLYTTLTYVLYKVFKVFSGDFMDQVVQAGFEPMTFIVFDWA